MPEILDDVKLAAVTEYQAEFNKSQGKFKVELPSCAALPFARFLRGAPNQPLAVAWKCPNTHDETQPTQRSSCKCQRGITHQEQPKQLLLCVWARMGVESLELARAGNKVPS